MEIPQQEHPESNDNPAQQAYDAAAIEAGRISAAVEITLATVVSEGDPKDTDAKLATFNALAAPAGFKLVHESDTLPDEASKPVRFDDDEKRPVKIVVDPKTAFDAKQILERLENVGYKSTSDADRDQRLKSLELD